MVGANTPNQSRNIIVRARPWRAYVGPDSISAAAADVRLRSASARSVPTPRPRGGRRRRRGRDAEAGSAAAARSHFIRRRLERPSAFRSIRTHGHGLLLTFLTRPVASQQSPVARRFRYAVDVRRNRRNPQIKRRKFHPCAKFKLFGRGRASTPIYCGYNGGDVRQSHHH